MTITEFIKSAGVRMSAERTDRNPNMDDSANMDHWRVRLRCGRSSMTLVFSQGYGHHGNAPMLRDVLDCLASDASVEDRTFDDWCDDLGFDVDSRKAERTYQATVKQTAKLRRLLGDSAFETLLSCERE